MSKAIRLSCINCSVRFCVSNVEIVFFVVQISGEGKDFNAVLMDIDHNFKGNISDVAAFQWERWKNS